MSKKKKKHVLRNTWFINDTGTNPAIPEIDFRGNRFSKVTGVISGRRFFRIGDPRGHEQAKLRDFSENNLRGYREDSPAMRQTFPVLRRGTKVLVRRPVFIVDADCVKCIECRKQESSIRALMIEYEKLLKKTDRSSEQTTRLEQVARELYRVGYVTDKNTTRPAWR